MAKDHLETGRDVEPPTTAAVGPGTAVPNATDQAVDRRWMASPVAGRAQDNTFIPTALPVPDPSGSRPGRSIDSDSNPPAVGTDLQPVAPRSDSQSADPEPPIDSGESSNVFLMPPEECTVDGSFDVSELLARDAPPWLFSAIVHMLALIVLGIVLFSETADFGIELEVEYADELGDQLDDEMLAMAEVDWNVDETIITPSDLEPVDDPLAVPDPTNPSLLALNLISDLPSEISGVALSGRQKGSKESLLAAYGGTATTEVAVVNGLKWLQRNQQKNGLWSLSGPFSDGVRGVKNEEAATAMALLAYQGAGHTHRGPSDDPFTRVVDRAWKALLKRQQKNGSFARKPKYNHFLYTQAQCTIAICELYAMTNDSKLRGPAQAAVDFCVAAQSPGGGWRYYPGRKGDMSVTGWFVMALKSAEMAGLHVPSETWMRVGEFLDSVQSDGGAQYSYLASKPPKPSMTAEGLLCRQYLGWIRNDPRLVRGVDVLLDNLIEWNERNVYYWYYATQVCHHMEREIWREWNEVMRKVIPANQVREGSEKGSWDPGGDRWGNQGGRLYVTCLSIYMLEVYYRHLPLYRQQLGR